jgi:hypothetical protein
VLKSSSTYTCFVVGVPLSPLEFPSSLIELYEQSLVPGNTMLEFLLKLRFATRPLVMFKLNDLNAEHAIFVSLFGSFCLQSLTFRAKVGGFLFLVWPFGRLDFWVQLFKNYSVSTILFFEYDNSSRGRS